MRRDADAVALRHAGLEVVQPGQDVAAAGLNESGVARPPRTTRIPPTVSGPAGTPGVAGRGVPLRHDPVGNPTSGKAGRGRVPGVNPRLQPRTAARHRQGQHLRETGDRPPHAAQAPVRGPRHPRMMGWPQDAAPVVSARGVPSLRHRRAARRCAWAISRHPHQKTRWTTSTDWRVDDGNGGTGQPPPGGPRGDRHEHTPIRRHGTGHGARRPDDGDGGSWRSR